MKSANITLNNSLYTLVDDSDEHHIDIHIPGLFQLIQVDSRDKKDNFLEDILDDIKKSQVITYRYSFAGVSIYDFEVKNSSWNDYPRPQSLGRQLLKRIGKKKVIGPIGLLGL